MALVALGEGSPIYILISARSINAISERPDGNDAKVSALLPIFILICHFNTKSCQEEAHTNRFGDVGSSKDQHVLPSLKSVDLREEGINDL